MTRDLDKWTYLGYIWDMDMDLDICKASLIRSDWGSSKISEIKWRTWSVESKCGCLYVSNQQQSKANTAYKSGLTQSKNAFLSRVNDPESKSTKSSTSSSSSSLLLPHCLNVCSCPSIPNVNPPLAAKSAESSCVWLVSVFSFRHPRKTRRTSRLSASFCFVFALV